MITGGHGLLGSRLVSLLIQRTPNAHIIVVSRDDRKAPWKTSSNVQQIYGDLRDANLWVKLPSDITHVFYLAASIPWKSEDKNKAKIVTDNLVPLAYLIEYSQRWPNLKQVIFSSSISVYTHTRLLLNENSLQSPVDIYGASKLAGEMVLLCLEFRGIRVVSLRYSSLYAYGQYEGTVLPIMVKRAIERKPILVYGNGLRTQDFLHCDDASNANIMAYKKQAQGVFNIGSGESVSMTELAQTISKLFTNGTAKIVYVPEKMEHDPGFRIDISKARQELDYRPLIQIEKGLQKFKKEMKSLKQ